MSENAKVLSVLETREAIASLRLMGYRVETSVVDVEYQKVQEEHDELIETMEFVHEMLRLALRAESYPGNAGVAIRMAMQKLKEQHDALTNYDELPF